MFLTIKLQTSQKNQDLEINGQDAFYLSANASEIHLIVKKIEEITTYFYGSSVFKKHGYLYDYKP